LCKLILKRDESNGEWRGEQFIIHVSSRVSEGEAIRRAVKQAFGMLASSGVDPEKLLELFYELRVACDAFIKAIEDVLGKMAREK
jgi:hypothetical protein